MSKSEISKQVDELTKSPGRTFVVAHPELASLRLQNEHSEKMLRWQIGLVVGTWALVLVTLGLVFTTLNSSLENERRETISRCNTVAATQSGDVMRSTGITEEETTKLYEDFYTICLRTDGFEK